LPLGALDDRGAHQVRIACLLDFEDGEKDNTARYANRIKQLSFILKGDATDKEILKWAEVRKKKQDQRKQALRDLFKENRLYVFPGRMEGEGERVDEITLEANALKEAEKEDGSTNNAVVAHFRCKSALLEKAKQEKEYCEARPKQGFGGRLTRLMYMAPRWISEKRYCDGWGWEGKKGRKSAEEEIALEAGASAPEEAPTGPPIGA
jgi:hypothetical protein